MGAVSVTHPVEQQGLDHALMPPGTGQVRVLVPQAASIGAERQVGEKPYNFIRVTGLGSRAEDGGAQQELPEGAGQGQGSKHKHA